MLFTLMVWGYVSILCYFTGVGVCDLMGGKSEAWSQETDQAPLLCFLGLTVITALLTVCSFILKIALAANLLAALPAAVLAVRKGRPILRMFRGSFRPIFSGPWPVRLAFGIIFLAVLWNATGTPLHYDTGLYHAQAVRWLEEYPVVPGLGNLDGRLAFNSSWWLPCAAFGFSFLEGPPSHGLNGWILLWMLIYCWPGVVAVSNRSFGWGSVGRVLILLLHLRYFIRFASSAATDLPATALASILFVTVGETLEQGSLPGSVPYGKTMTLMALALFAPTVKLSVLPILLVVPLILLMADPRKRLSLTAGTIVAAVALGGPWVARSILISGYPIYPLGRLDLVVVDWKIPRDRVDGMLRIIQAFSRAPGPNAEAALNLPATQWIPRWFSLLLPADKALILSLGAAVVLRTALHLQGFLKGSKEISPQGAALHAASWAGVLFWFLGAPNPRFGYAFLFPAMVLLAVPAIHVGAAKVPNAIRIGLLGTLAGVVGGACIYSWSAASAGARLWKPLGYPEVPLVRKSLPRGYVHVPEEGELTWYGPLPAAPSVPAGVEWRGSNPGQGFRPSAP